MQLYAKGSRVPFWKEIALGEKDTTCNVNFSRALSPNMWDVEYVVLQRPFAFNVSQDMWTVESKGYHFDIYIYVMFNTVTFREAPQLLDQGYAERWGPADYEGGQDLLGRAHPM
jgi:hypothetical protein